MRYERRMYKGPLNGTIHVVAGGGGANINDFSCVQPKWSVFSDIAHGFVTLTAVDHSNLKFEYRRSSDGTIHDSFEIVREYRDILSCWFDSCSATTLAFYDS